VWLFAVGVGVGVGVWWESGSASGIMLAAEAPALLVSSCRADRLTPLILHGRHVFDGAGHFYLGESYSMVCIYEAHLDWVEVRMWNKYTMYRLCFQ
jgi:hypothetical protein